LRLYITYKTVIFIGFVGNFLAAGDFLENMKKDSVKYTIHVTARLGMEPRRRRPLRERRLKAGKMLRWSILSESPSSCAAKGLSEQGERSQWL